jgi:hypothetical protein
MTDDAIMDFVWNAPDCPVKLTAPDSEYPWGPEVPWPRVRIAGPTAPSPSFLHVCPCRNGRPPVVIDEDDMPMVLRPATVELARHVVALAGSGNPGPPQKVAVYLGQCGDCGRIYWALVR